MLLLCLFSRILLGGRQVSLSYSELFIKQQRTISVFVCNVVFRFSFLQVNIYVSTQFRSEV